MSLTTLHLVRERSRSQLKGKISYRNRVKKEECFQKSKVTINPSYEWYKDAKVLNISYRELEVFALSMDGHNNKEIT